MQYNILRWMHRGENNNIGIAPKIVYYYFLFVPPKSSQSAFQWRVVVFVIIIPDANIYPNELQSYTHTWRESIKKLLDSYQCAQSICVFVVFGFTIIITLTFNDAFRHFFHTTFSIPRALIGASDHRNDMHHMCLRSASLHRQFTYL